MNLRAPWLRWLLSGAAVLALAFLEWRFGVLGAVAAALDPARVEVWLAAAGPLAPLVYMLVMALAVLSPLPTVPLDLIAGRVFGPLPGTLYSVTGATLGSLASFALARWLGRDLLARWLKGHIHFCRQCSDRLLGKLVFLGRLVPVAPFDLLSYGAGLTRMSALRFAVASFLGMLPLTFLYNAAGELVFRQRWLAWVGGGVLVALFFLLPYWIERYDLFSMRRYFRHAETPELAAASVAARDVGGERRDG